MCIKIPSIFENLINVQQIKIAFSNFNFLNRFFTYNKTVNDFRDAKIVYLSLQNNLPSLNQGDVADIEQLKNLPTLLIGGESDILKKDERDNQINLKIDEAVALMNINKSEEAKELLLKTLGEINNQSKYLTEQVRVYNNLGVIYNCPKPEGDYEKAIQYFNFALEKDSNFVKSKMNLASAYLNKGDKESIQKGFDLVNILWQREKTPEILRVLLLSIYKKESSPKKVLEYIKLNLKEIEQIINQKDYLLNLVASLYLETGNINESYNYVFKALKLSQNSAELLSTKARVLMLRAQKNHKIPSEFEIVPEFDDYKDVRKALKIFRRAKEIAINQNKNYLIPEIQYGISVCLIWLGKYDESIHGLKEIDKSELSEQINHQINILDFANHINNKNFETAYNILITNENFDKLDYTEKHRVARIFIFNGAPEQAKALLDLILLDAEKNKDIFYWFDLSGVFVLLDKQQEAISAAGKARTLSEDMNEDIQKMAHSHYNAIMFHYSKSVESHNSETSRLVEGMFEFQKKFPDEKILTPIKAIDNEGNPTTEIKDMLTQMKERYEYIKSTFIKNPIPTYALEKAFSRSYSELLYSRDDPEFIIQFTDITDSFYKEMNDNLTSSEGIIFDYSSLLDLAKMDFLGFLEKINKPIYIHELLFQKIQEEMLRNNIPELRSLWNFLRQSKSVKFFRKSNNQKLTSNKLENIFDKWIIETMKFSKDNKLTLCTNDLVFFRYSKSENIKPINVMILLRNFLCDKHIDKRMYSRAIGDLAERFYVFLSYTGDDLFEIVLEDGGKITPRTYHLVREVFLPGSILESFTSVYSKFIDLFWKTGSLPQEKVNWLKFLTNTVTEIIDKDFILLKSEKIINQKEAEEKIDKFRLKLNPAINSLAFMWKTTTNNGSKDDLRELLKIANEVLNKEYLEHSKNIIVQRIKDKVET